MRTWMSGAALRKSFRTSMSRYRIRYWLEATRISPRAALDVERAAELLRALEEADGVRQEAPALVGEQRRSPRAAALAVQLDAEPLLERQQPVAQALLRDPQDRRRPRICPCRDSSTKAPI